jgi:hypothetical protein
LGTKFDIKKPELARADEQKIWGRQKSGKGRQKSGKQKNQGKNRVALTSAARDPEGAKYFSRFAVARSAIGHWLVQKQGVY